MKEQIKKENVEDILPLTSLQEGILFHYLSNERSNLYFEQLELKIDGFYDRKLISDSIEYVVKNNEMLRVVFRWRNIENPIQIILRDKKTNIVFHDLTNISNEKQKEYIEKIKKSDRDNGFDITKEVFRVYVCKIKENKWSLIISNHHIIYDGWSNGVILKEFLEAYNSLSRNSKLVTRQKGKFREFINYTKSIEGKEYWEKYMQGFNEITTFPPMHKRNINQEKEIEKRTFKFNKQLTKKINDFSKNHKVTVATILYSALGILLNKYTNSSDVLFGITVSGRRNLHSDLDNVVGLFINTIPLRFTNIENMSVAEILDCVNKTSFDREAVEGTPIVDIKNLSELKNEASLFDVIMVIENYPIDKLLKTNKDLNLKIKDYENYSKTNFNLTIDVNINQNSIKFDYLYDKLIFKKEYIERIAKHFNNIILQMMEKKSTKVSEINMLTLEEKNKLIYKFNNNKSENKSENSIHHLLEKYAVLYPDRIAAKYKKESITYKNLNEKSNQLAWVLREKGILKDRLVGILGDRSIEMLTSILGVFKSGGAYIPIEKKYPKERIKYVLNECKVKVLILILKNQDDNILDYLYILKETGVKHVILLNPINDQYVNQFINQYSESYRENLTTLECIEKFNKNNLNTTIDLSSLAYVIFTSGSTGKPKGAMIEHKGMMNHIYAKIKDLDINKESIIAQNSSHCFDISIWQFLAPIAVGGTTVIYDNEMILNVNEFIKNIVDEKINILEVVPSYLSIMIENLEINKVNFEYLKYLVVTGEELKYNIVKKWFDMYDCIKMVNAYGPTEASDDITHYIMSEVPEKGKIPIGKPVRNFNIYVLDDYMNLCPIGVRGTIYVSGIGVGRGYYNDISSTKKAFSIDPFIKNKEIRLYNTGDIGYWNNEGNIIFLGRKDNQVKISGFRIELSEIERAIESYYKVNNSIVVHNIDNLGNSILVAYIVTQSSFDKHNLINFLKERLPYYMIPTKYIELENFPLNDNGKVDRKALPRPNLKIYKEKEREYKNSATCC